MSKDDELPLRYHIAHEQSVEQDNERNSDSLQSTNPMSVEQNNGRNSDSLQSTNPMSVEQNNGRNYDSLQSTNPIPTSESAESPQVVHRFNANLPILTTLAIACVLELGLLLSLALVRRYGAGNGAAVQPGFSHMTAPFRNYTTVSDAPPLCSHIPGKIYARKGTVADCAVAYAFCMAVVVPHRMGLGGGFFATLYIRSKKSVVVLEAREAAPRSLNGSDFDYSHSTKKGARATGVPGFLRGLEALHARFGRLPWSSLLEDAVKLARFGFPVYRELATVLAKYGEIILQRQTLKHIFRNPATKQLYTENETLRQPALAMTLLAIAKEGYEGFAHGDFGAKYVKDVTDNGGLLEREDMERYNAVWKAPTTSVYQDGSVVMSPTPPGAGPLLAFILGTMDMFRISKDALLEDNSLSYHRLLETFKFAHPFRDDLGDSSYENVADTVRDLSSMGQALKTNKRIADSSTFPDAIFYVFDMQQLHETWAVASEASTTSKNNDVHSYNEFRWRPVLHKPHGQNHRRKKPKNVDIKRGAANAVFTSPGGDVLAFSGSLGMLFGAKEASHSTGILLNSALAAFTPRLRERFYGHAGVSLNHAKPGKRPMAALAPTIVLGRDAKPIAAVAAAEITDTPQYAATILCRLLFMNKTIMDAISEPKIRFRANVKGALYDAKLRHEIFQDLQNKGHKMLVLEDTITNAVGIFWDEDDDIYPGINEGIGGYFDGD
ncbi:scoloptoxin SSD14-like [Ornithodoros turicata]|uniref:scoloptoxin SSD14-like n=1 Tax=Ornithodoros turicata TaxID=34597 RepID=UPI003139A6F9